MKKLKTKYLILGAGITGLSFANFIEKDYLIIEKEKEVGGFCRTIYENEYIWDYAGHFFHFSDIKIKKLFLDEMSEEELVFQRKNTKIFFKNLVIDYPFQKNIHQLDKEEFIECLYDLFNKQEKDKYKNFLEMLYGKFGKSITEYFLKPYNEKLYACNLNKLDVDAMGRFFPYANTNEIINNMKEKNNISYNDTFLYPKKGAIYFIDKIFSKLDSDRIKLEQKILKIDYKEKKICTKDYEIEYEYLINTIPLNKLCNLLNLRKEEVNKVLTYNKVLVFNLGFDKKSKYQDIHWAYIPDKEINFYRIGFYDNILNQNKLSMYIEIGFNSNEEISIKKEFERTIENLKKLGIIEEHKLIASSALVMSPAYVHISKESEKLKFEIKKELIGEKIYSIGRYGDWKYCSIEDSIKDALNLSEELKKI